MCVMQTHAIISEIERHAAERGIAPATVTSRAVKNSRLYAHLKAGGDCTTRTIQRLREYMSSRQEGSPNA